MSMSLSCKQAQDSKNQQVTKQFAFSLTDSRLLYTQLDTMDRGTGAYNTGAGIYDWCIVIDALALLSSIRQICMYACMMHLYITLLAFRLAVYCSQRCAAAAAAAYVSHVSIYLRML